MSGRGFLTDTLGLAASQYVARAMVLARGLVAAVALGPAGYGVWNALNLFLDYGAYTTVGAVQGLDLDLPAAVRRGDEAMVARLLGGAWTIVLAGGLLFAGVLAVSISHGHPAMLGTLGPLPVGLMLAAVLLQLALQVHASALRARGRFAVVSAATAAQALLGGGLGLAAVLRFGIAGLMAGWVLGTLVALAWMRVASPGVPLRPSAPGTGWALAKSGFPVFAAFAASVLLRSVDRLALIRYGHPASLGLYAIGVLAAGLVLYLPESAATVLYPRVTAAARGALDVARTRLEVARAHRSLAVLLPLVVGVAIVWAGPFVLRLLPAYRDGVPVLRVLALGALMLSAATLPGYFLMGSGFALRVLGVSVAALAVTATLVFVIAARDPRPVAVAVAASLGYALFALAMVSFAARELFGAARERAGFVLASLVPSLWTGGLAFAACSVGSETGWGTALARTGAVTAGYVPVLWWFGRGTGLRRFARDWIRVRAHAA
jgi:O-antigen/teichoic acid export membrane protein